LSSFGIERPPKRFAKRRVLLHRCGIFLANHLIDVNFLGHDEMAEVRSENSNAQARDPAVDLGGDEPLHGND